MKATLSDTGVFQQFCARNTIRQAKVQARSLRGRPVTAASTEIIGFQSPGSDESPEDYIDQAILNRCEPRSGFVFEEGVFYSSCQG